MKIKIIPAVLLISCFLLSSALQAQAEKKWTIMVYCCADNNLDLAGVGDLNELELSGSDENMNIIFLLDRLGMDNTHLYYALHDSAGLPGGEDNNIISTMIDTSAAWLAPEEDMGNPQTLQNFLLWTLEHYPAEHYLLSIWDHGSGIFKDTANPFPTRGECWDDNGGNPDDYIDLSEFKSVIAQVYAQIGRKLDIVGHDVCLAGQFETHYQIRDYANISLASADNEPFDGWDYEGPFVNLKNNPNMTPEELAYQIVEFYYNSYGAFAHCCNTMAAVDLRLMLSDFMPAFDAFNDALIRNFAAYGSQIRNIRAGCPTYNPPNLEYWNFVENIETDQALPQDLRDAASNLIEQLQSTFIHYRVAGYSTGHGCTIWFPGSYSDQADVNAYETKIDFSQTSWSRFLRIFAGEFLITTDRANEGFLESAYMQNFNAFNGTPPYHWKKLNGQFPYGLEFISEDTAKLSGIPTYAATFGFTLKVTDSSIPALEDARYFLVKINPPKPINGDANGSGKIDVSDAVYLINFIFEGGPAPNPYLLGDTTCDEKINLVDIVLLINYIFRGGPPPCQSF